jgi:superfamily II DNA/RNA helicase
MATGLMSQGKHHTTFASSAFLNSLQFNVGKQNKNASANRQSLSLAFSTLKDNSAPSSKLHMIYTRTEEDDKLDAFLEEATATDDFFADVNQFPTFESLGIKSPVLLKRVKDMLDGENTRPSAVQAASFTAINLEKDVNIGAETGSGKTLAYLLPLIDDVLQRKEKAKDESGKVGHLGYDYARAIILVPNKELAHQVLRMAVELCGGPRSVVWDSNGENRMLPGGDVVDVHDSEIVRLGIMPGALNSPEDYKPIRLSVNDPMNNAPLDLLITTPASLGPIAENPKNIDMFADIETLVIDEADMLFDGGYLAPLNRVLLGFRRADRLDASFDVKKTQHVLVAATLPDMGLKSAEAYVLKKFPYATKVTMKGMHNARHYGLKDQTVWIKDDDTEDMPKKKRMERLIQILGDDPSSSGIGLAGEKVMVFLNSASGVDGAAGALTRAGINAIPLHAKLSLTERTENLNKFREYDAAAEHNDERAVPVLVCTDHAARGLDIPGVTAVVQLQFAGNVVSHLHRMGRCGRAGNRDGRGVILYGGVESELVEVVRKAEQDQDTLVLQGNDIEDEEVATGGKVQNAFSRKRGFTKKRKKIARKEREGDYND